MFLAGTCVTVSHNTQLKDVRRRIASKAMQEAGFTWR
jgi:hypothetical protein